jgi:hypothetical protein
LASRLVKRSFSVDQWKSAHALGEQDLSRSLPIRQDLFVRGRTRTEWWGVVLDAPDARVLAEFYSRLLDWPIATTEPNWAVIRQPDSETYLSFQTEQGYVRPVWPAIDGSQQMMMHLDIEVDDLPTAVAHAIELGATLPDHQPQESVRVLLDPAGHPFCLYLDERPIDVPYIDETD